MKKLAVTIMLAAVLAGCGRNYSSGDRIGMITKFSNKGLFCKTWEGQMNLGGFKTETDDKGNSSIVANVWDFYVPDGPLVEQVKQAMDSGARVKIGYQQWYVAPVCSQGSEYTATKIEILH